MTKIFTYILSAVLISLEACSNEEDNPQSKQEEDSQGLVGITLSRGETNKVARDYGVFLYFYQNNSGKEDSLHHTYHFGSYHAEAGYNPTATLIPWDNSKNEKNVSKGLYAKDGSYYMALTSPPKAPSVISKEGIDTIYGFKIDRFVANQEPLYISKAFPVTISGRGEIIDHNYKDVIHIDDHSEDGSTLQDPRARVRFVFTCDSLVLKAFVEKVELQNVANSAWWYPMSGSYQDWTIDNRGTVVVYDGSVDEDGSDGGIMLSSDEGNSLEIPKKKKVEYTDEDGNGWMYILAQDFSESDPITGDKLHVSPHLKITMYRKAQTDDDDDALNLGFDLKPMHDYVINVNIITVYVHVEVTVSKWEDETSTETFVYEREDVEVKDLSVEKWEDVNEQTENVEK